MTTYEILLMLDPEQAEARQDDIVSRTRDLVEKGGGAWHSHDAWGRRRLAYPILHKEEGVYHLVVFDSEAETLEEISRVLKIDDSVLRHLATRHIAGSRTSAPRDEAAAPVAAPAEAAAPAETPAPEAAEPKAAEPEAAEPEAAEPAEAEPETTISEADEPEYADAEEEEPAEEEE